MSSRREGVVFGKIALKKGFVSEADLKDCIERLEELAEEEGAEPSLKQVLREKGYVTEEQVEEVERLRKRVVQETNIPGYELHEKLGEGATGVVYRATQLSLDRPVAIKVLYPSDIEDESYLEQFYREARTVAKLNHEGIIQGIDVGKQDGVYYFVMEYVEGESLDTIIDREGHIGEDRTLDIGLQAARALRYAADHGLIHRDIKPENIMIDQEGVAKLSDLGLAKKLDRKDESITQMGITVGTPHYMSPEQATGEDLNVQTDIYALGASLYHAATGEVPFDADAATSVVTKHVTEELVPPKEKNPRLSREFNAIIEKMMKKNPADRYLPPDELITDLEHVQSGNYPEHAVVRRIHSGSDASGKRRSGKRASSGLRSQDAARSFSSSRGPSVFERMSLWWAVPVVVLIGGTGYLFMSYLFSGNPEPTASDSQTRAKMEKEDAPDGNVGGTNGKGSGEEEGNETNGESNKDRQSEGAQREIWDIPPPVARWRLDWDAADAGDHNLDGWLKGDASIVGRSKVGAGSLSLDGDGDFLGIPSSDRINTGGVRKKWTVSIWFRVNDPSVTSRKQVIYEEGGHLRGLIMYIYDGKLYVGGWNTGESGWSGTFLSTSDVRSDTWHHAALTLNGNASVEPEALTGYLDGKPFGSGEGSQLWSHPGNIAAGAVRTHSRFHDGIAEEHGGHGLSGNLDDLQLFNQSLDTSLIQKLSNITGE